MLKTRLEGFYIQKTTRRSSMFCRACGRYSMFCGGRRSYSLLNDLSKHFYVQNTSGRSFLCLEDLWKVLYVKKFAGSPSMFIRPRKGLLYLEDLLKNVNVGRPRECCLCQMTFIRISIYRSSLFRFLKTIGRSSLLKKMFYVQKTVEEIK